MPAPQFCAAVVTPLAPERYKLQVTLMRETHEKLRRAQALARHTLPGGDVGAILDRALTLLIDDLERRRFARAASPRPSPGHASGRHIPAAVRRAVWQRDEGRCVFVGRTGRCRETAFLEFHHGVPYAAGGAATADNIQLRCRAHNQYEARLFFGDTLVRERQQVWEHTPSDRIRDGPSLGLTRCRATWASGSCGHGRILAISMVRCQHVHGRSDAAAPQLVARHANGCTKSDNRQSRSSDGTVRGPTEPAERASVPHRGLPRFPGFETSSTCVTVRRARGQDAPQRRKTWRRIPRRLRLGCRAGGV